MRDIVQCLRNEPPSPLLQDQAADVIEDLRSRNRSLVNWVDVLQRECIGLQGKWGAEMERVAELSKKVGELDECRRLLREAVGECVQQHGGWFVATLDDEWLAAARKAAGGDDVR